MKTYKDYDWYNDFVSSFHIPNYIDQLQWEGEEGKYKSGLSKKSLIIYGNDSNKTISRKYVIDRLVEELGEDEVIEHCNTDYHSVTHRGMTESYFNHYLVNVLRRVVRPQWSCWWF